LRRKERRLETEKKVEEYGDLKERREGCIFRKRRKGKKGEKAGD
jgi:hypothetical protein